MTHVPSVDKGLPGMCLDEDTNTLNFLRCGPTGGLLIEGTVALTPITKREYGSALVADTLTSTLISYSPSSAEKIIRVLVGGDGYGEFTVKINTVVWATLRNSWNDRTVSLNLDSKSLSDSDTITVEAKNVSIEGGGSCTYEAFVYLGDG